jgi:hypothetical protein
LYFEAAASVGEEFADFDFLLLVVAEELVYRRVVSLR